MKHEIIKINEGYITISDEEIKLGDHFYDPDNKTFPLNWYGNDYNLDDKCKKLVSTYFKCLYNDEKYGGIPLLNMPKELEESLQKEESKETWDSIFGKYFGMMMKEPLISNFLTHCKKNYSPPQKR